jgi:hypothetical protein
MMPLRFLCQPIFVLGLACLPALWAADRAVAGSPDDSGVMNDDGVAPNDDAAPDNSSGVLRIPGMPPIQLPPGVHVFGPEGQPLLAPTDRSEGGPADPGPPKRPVTQSLSPEQKAAAAKAAALKLARAAHATHAELRAQALDGLFNHLAAASDADEATGIATAIEHVWMESDSDTASLLMSRAMSAQGAGHLPLALTLYDKVLTLAPDWAEAWDKRATTRFLGDDLQGAMADLEKTLQLEPRHFSALIAMGFIWEREGQDRHALAAFRKALALNPQQPEIKAIVDKLQVEVEGRDI